MNASFIAAIACGIPRRPGSNTDQSKRMFTGDWLADTIGIAAHGVSILGDVAKWTKAEVCKTSIRRFESARRLQPPPPFSLVPLVRGTFRASHFLLRGLPQSHVLQDAEQTGRLGLRWCQGMRRSLPVL